jgi:hypothetical protein
MLLSIDAIEYPLPPKNSQPPILPEVKIKMNATPFISFLRKELKLFFWSALLSLLVLLVAFLVGKLGPLLQAPGFTPPSVWEAARLGASTGFGVLFIGTAVNLFLLARDIWRGLGSR